MTYRDQSMLPVPVSSFAFSACECLLVRAILQTLNTSHVVLWEAHAMPFPQQQQQQQQKNVFSVSCSQVFVLEMKFLQLKRRIAPNIREWIFINMKRIVVDVGVVVVGRFEMASYRLCVTQLMACAETEKFSIQRSHCSLWRTRCFALFSMPVRTRETESGWVSASTVFTFLLFHFLIINGYVRAHINSQCEYVYVLLYLLSQRARERNASVSFSHPASHNNNGHLFAYSYSRTHLQSLTFSYYKIVTRQFLHIYLHLHFTSS